MQKLDSEESLEGKMIKLKCDIAGELYRYPADRKMSKWVLEQMKPEPSLEAKGTKRKLSYLEHVMRGQGSLGKKEDIMLWKIGSSRKRGRLILRWNGSIKEAKGTSLQEPSRAARMERDLVDTMRLWGLHINVDSTFA